MVTRNPVSEDGGLNAPTSPPYPVTPVTTNASSQFQSQATQNVDQPTNETESTDLNSWSEEVQKHELKDVPQSLRVGPPGYSQHGSREVLRPNPMSTNPYLRKQPQYITSDSIDSSATAWAGPAEQPKQPTESNPPVHLAKETPPRTQSFSNLSISESSTNPWQPALNEKAAETTTPLARLSREDSGQDAWADVPPEGEASKVHDKPVLINIEDDGNESPAWDDDSIPSPTIQELPADTTPENRQILADQHVWDVNQGRYIRPIPSNVVVDSEVPAQQGDGWNLIDHEPLPDSGEQQSGIIGANGTVLERFPAEDHPPALPPRRSEEIPPPQPPRPVLDTNTTGSSSIASPATATARKQKKETYEIKNISWHDVTAAQNPRVSPILVQNANGPCPLLALVNALTLSTPPNLETALVETLRSREQVSLGLLLDAVFDELMSGRRGDAAQELPDVGDLYAFLITLHTGMNVNPRFFPPAQTKSPVDPRNSMSHVHPAEREEQTPGTFEDTREMKLYSTFSVPLIHGWLPERDSPAYIALKRSAQSYEDAQNMFFHEEVLEDKLQNEGLNFEEQAKLEDIATIKAFFDSAATQLTTFGLETITTSLAPGAVAILFRNDHFSTLYRHPDTLQLLQLVTDMGYAGHEEVVWESLIDVSGENAEFFSGDFRLVGGPPASPIQSHSRSQSHSNDGWTTVPIRNQNQRRQQTLNIPSAPDPAPQSPLSPNTEQEDHDLALALQLHDEEEERYRNEVARRRREAELSHQYIEQQGRGSSIPVNTRGGGRAQGRIQGQNSPAQPPRPLSDQRPVIPPRRSGPQSQAIGSRPIDPEAGVDAPPPSYEQAANQAAYVPPSNHPAHPSASPNSSQRMSAYSANSQGIGIATPNPRLGRRGTGPTLIEQIEQSGRRRNTSSSVGPGLTQGQQGERSKDCIVM